MSEQEELLEEIYKQLEKCGVPREKAELIPMIENIRFLGEGCAAALLYAEGSIRQGIIERKKKLPDWKLPSMK